MPVHRVPGAARAAGDDTPAVMTMPDSREAAGHWLRDYLTALEISMAAARRNAKRALGWLGPIQILPYRGFGNDRRQSLKGRVLERKEVGSPKADHPWWTNLMNMYRRFATNEIPGVRVRARFYGQVCEAVTDPKGYFDVEFGAGEALDRSRLWHNVELELLDPVVKGQGEVKAIGRLLVPPRQTAFGIISDVDDTILETHATEFWKTARITFLRNARTRMPLAGVAAFYQALSLGPNGGMKNPVFYVSSSAWNLYDLLSDFLELNELPPGPLLLQALGFANNKLIHPGHGHKLEKIRRIMATYPEMPFLLIGDSGQKDPELYLQAVAEHPGRIKAVYIREVARRANNERLKTFELEFQRHGVMMLAIRDTAEASRDAFRRGLIAATSVPDIQLDVIADVEQRPSA
jgi:phosphatidate phosphatase APP1